MVLFILFTIFGLMFTLLFFFSKEKFRLDRLLMAIWAISIGIAQLRLSPLELKWTPLFWFVLILFFGLFFLASRYFNSFFKVKTKKSKFCAIPPAVNGVLYFWLLFSMTLISIVANIYIYQKFSTLPILSSAPEKMRFIINLEVFGLWEYIALLPRIFIPLSFVYLLLGRTEKKWPKILAWLNIILGFLILSLYASRVTIIFAILFCYFIYLMLKIKKISVKKIINASVVVVIVVLLIIIAIPAFRHYITFRDYEYEKEFNAFTYLANLTQLNIPEKYNFITPLYIIPAFNLQAIMRATDYYSLTGHYHGRYELSIFPGFKEIKIPWKPLFKYWWITATFLFEYWVDFGIFGIILATIFWSALLSAVYYWAIKCQNILLVMLYAYFGFVVIMSIYTNYFIRSEFYLDIILIFAIGCMIDNKIKN